MKLPAYILLPAAYLAALALWQPKLAAAYALMGAAGFWLYRRDKAAARNQQWRVPEKTLLLVDFLGGWTGSWAARHRHRHKTGKTSFIYRYWLSVIGNLAFTGLLWLAHGDADGLLPLLLSRI